MSRIGNQLNVNDEPITPCCFSPITGQFRDGFCHTDQSDNGVHTVCAVLTEEFLQFSKSKGNDLSTPRPQYGFPGLKEGDNWCLCVLRWKEAKEAGKAPNVKLSATNKKSLEYVTLEELKEQALEDDEELFL